MAHRRKLSISSLSSVAFGCVKLGVGVTVAAGAVAYAAVQVYRGPSSQGDAEKEQTRDDAEVTDPAPPAEDTTHPHTSDTSTDACNDYETETASSHAAEPAAEPTPPDSPLPETPIDMTHASREEEKTPVRTHTHRRKVSFAPIPETEEAIFVSALAPQEPTALPQQQQQDAAPKTNGAAKKKKKSQKKKKTHAQAGSESQDQNALAAA